MTNEQAKAIRLKQAKQAFGAEVVYWNDKKRATFERVIELAKPHCDETDDYNKLSQEDKFNLFAPIAKEMNRSFADSMFVARKSKKKDTYINQWIFDNLLYVEHHFQIQGFGDEYRDTYFPELNAI